MRDGFSIDIRAAERPYGGSGAIRVVSVGAGPTPGVRLTGLDAEGGDGGLGRVAPGPRGVCGGRSPANQAGAADGPAGGGSDDTVLRRLNQGHFGLGVQQLGLGQYLHTEHPVGHSGLSIYHPLAGRGRQVIAPGQCPVPLLAKCLRCAPV